MGHKESIQTNKQTKIYLSIYLSICLSVCLSVRPSNRPPAHPPTHPPTHPSNPAPIPAPTHTPTRLITYLPIYLSICLVRPTVRPFVHRSLLRLFWVIVFPLNTVCGAWSLSGRVTLENHCTRTAQSSRGGCSRRVHKIVYLAVKKGNILGNILFLKIQGGGLKYKCWVFIFTHSLFIWAMKALASLRICTGLP